MERFIVPLAEGVRLSGNRWQDRTFPPHGAQKESQCGNVLSASIRCTGLLTDRPGPNPTSPVFAAGGARPYE
jgi:hypothetical protein